MCLAPQTVRLPLLADGNSTTGSLVGSDVVVHKPRRGTKVTGMITGINLPWCALFDLGLFWEESLSGDGCARGLLAKHKRHFFVFLIAESYLI